MKTQLSHECSVVHSSFIHQNVEATVYTSPTVVQRHFHCTELLGLGQKTKQNNCLKDLFTELFSFQALHMAVLLLSQKYQTGFKNVKREQSSLAFMLSMCFFPADLQFGIFLSSLCA